MRVFGHIDSPQRDSGISGTSKGRQPLFEVLDGDDAVLRHALRPPCPNVEELAGRHRSFGPYPEGSPRSQGQSSLAGGVGLMLFKGGNQVFSIHDVQYGASRVRTARWSSDPCNRFSLRHVLVR